MLGKKEEMLDGDSTFGGTTGEAEIVGMLIEFREFRWRKKTNIDRRVESLVMEPYLWNHFVSLDLSCVVITINPEIMFYVFLKGGLAQLRNMTSCGPNNLMSRPLSFHFLLQTQHIVSIDYSKLEAITKERTLTIL